MIETTLKGQWTVEIKQSVVMELEVESNGPGRRLFAER
jgi:hypothetical protein